jgi:hypothetical protein
MSDSRLVRPTAGSATGRVIGSAKRLDQERTKLRNRTGIQAIAGGFVPRALPALICSTCSKFFKAVHVGHLTAGPPPQALRGLVGSIVSEAIHLSHSLFAKVDAWAAHNKAKRSALRGRLVEIG